MDARIPKFDRVKIQANTLTFASYGHREFWRLLGLFGHGHSTVGLRTLRHFPLGALDSVR